MKILVTGGAGSIGSRVVDRLFKEGHEVHVVDTDETRLYWMLRDEYAYKVKTYVIDVRDADAVNDLLRQGFDIIIHAAAYKHVPTGEYFPDQMVAVNIQGALNVFRAAVAHNVKRVVVVSTDKAAYPTGVMGASKLIQERMALSMVGKGATRFNVVRFGNVVMSRGGVVERFAGMVKEGKRLILMDAQMTRFWMDYDDAVDLVLHAAKDDANGCVYSMITRGWRLADLARAFGKKEGDWDVIGRRKGEKIDEVLITEEEVERSELVDHRIVKVWPEVAGGKRPHELKHMVISSNPPQLLTVEEMRDRLSKADLL
jgi:UDP-N-acetylglucosamine 4,6-dehydratase/5-epimerase